jgi:ribosomal protein L11 methyltransferase
MADATGPQHPAPSAQHPVSGAQDPARGAEHPAWPYVEFDAPPEQADDLGSALIDAGATGVEQRDLPGGRTTLVAYFTEAPDVDALRSALERALGLGAGQIPALRAGATPDDDWLVAWKRGYEPIPVGERLLVLPSWRRDQAAAYPGRTAVEIDPGMAFGTGTHETTRLCLEWLDEKWRGGSLLDVGTGTGILAIAAALLDSHASIAAVDVDPLAIEVARENAETNGVAGRITFRVCGPEAVGGRNDTVLANLTADVILASREALAGRVRPGGFLVLSGVLLEQAREVVEAFERDDFHVRWRRDAGEWTAVALRAAPGR